MVLAGNACRTERAAKSRRTAKTTAPTQNGETGETWKQRTRGREETGGERAWKRGTKKEKQSGEVEGNETDRIPLEHNSFSPFCTKKPPNGSSNSIEASASRGFLFSARGLVPRGREAMK